MAFGFLPSCVQMLSRATAELPHGQSWQKRGWEKGLAPGGTPVNGSGQGDSKQEAVSAALRPPPLRPQLCSLPSGQDLN